MKRRKNWGRNSDGSWFRHRGLSDPGPLLRETSTTTGAMLTAPFRHNTANYPPLPPQGYSKRETANYKNSNLFSIYDNRHSFQDHGVYFGDGRGTRTLGKSVLSADSRLHWTDADFLKHYGRTVTDHEYNTQYNAEYKGKPTDDPPTKRRFPKIYKDPGSTLPKLDTTTTEWFARPDVPYETPLQVLASCQEPFPTANAWRYSYHGLSRCYPAYEMNSKRYRSWLTPETPSTGRKETGSIM